MAPGKDIECDCLNICGDDPRLKDGRAEHCRGAKRSRARDKERRRLLGIVADLPDDTIARLAAGTPTTGDCQLAATTLTAAKQLLKV